MREYRSCLYGQIIEEINGKAAEKIDISEDGEGKHVALKVDGVWYLFQVYDMPFHFKEVHQ